MWERHARWNLKLTEKLFPRCLTRFLSVGVTTRRLILLRDTQEHLDRRRLLFKLVCIFFLNTCLRFICFFYLFVGRIDLPARRLNSLTNTGLISRRPGLQVHLDRHPVRSRREKTTTRQRNQQEEEKLGGRRKSSGVCSFNLSTLVQIPDGLHGQWTEIHPKVGKKYVILSSEALICLF